MILFKHLSHPRALERMLVGPPKVADAAAVVHGPSLVGRFNAAAGLKVTVIVGTMWAAYLFTLLALISLPAALGTGDKIIIVAWIAQTLLQLVLLPVILVGQNVQAVAADARANATFQDAEMVLHECQQLEAHLQAQDAALTALIADARPPAK